MNFHSLSQKISFWLIALALFLAFMLSIVSWLDICSLQCSTTKNFRLLGLPFAFIGMAFFPVLILIHFLSTKIPLLLPLVPLAIAGSVGSEVMFILIQKWQIGHWCPVCLGIAACVVFAACIYLASYIGQLIVVIKNHNKELIMQKIKHGILALSCSFIGFLIALCGVTQVDLAQAEVNDIKGQIALGTPGKPVEIYIVTDWFCSSCRKIEPLWEKLYPKISSDATIYFIDFPLHRKSLNYSPYNLAFLMHNKSEYFKARNMLSKLTLTKDNPKNEDIEQAAKNAGLSFQELPYIDIRAGMEFFDSIDKQYHIRATPSVIIVRPNRKAIIKLEGDNNISEVKVVTTIKQIMSL